MKDWLVWSYIYIKSGPIVHGGIIILAIVYKYNYRKVLGYIATEGSGSNEPGDPYISCFPDIYYNISVCSVVRPHLLGRYSNSCNAIYNTNRIRQSDLVIEK